MIKLINELLNPGDNVVLYLTGEIEPVRGSFMKISDSAILLRDANGLNVVRIESVSRITMPAKELSAKEPICNPEVEQSALQTPANEYSGDADAAPDGNEIMNHDDNSDIDSESFSPIFVPKVVGHIDLDSIVDPRRKRQNNAVRPTEDNPMVPTGGTVNSIGPAFGFITTVEGESLFFSRGEIMQRNRGDEIYKGMPVVFTPGHNDKGGVARCVHVPMTMQEQLEWIEQIEQYDYRNARLLASQLLFAFPEDSELADTLRSFDIRPQHSANSFNRRGVPVADKTLAAVSQGHYVEPVDLLRAEKEIAATKPYEEAFDLISQLLDYAMTNSRQQCYQLFVRLIKLARSHDDIESSLATIDQAIEFYANEAGSRTYFEGLRRKASSSDIDVAYSRDEVAETCDKIMSSIRTNVLICNNDSDHLAEVSEKIGSTLAPLNDCVCGTVDFASLPADSQLERRFFYETLRSLSVAVGAKFDTEFDLPDESRFVGEGVSEFSAMAELSSAIKSLRATLADHPDASKKKLHVVCLVKNFGRFVDAIAEGNLSENFMRHLKAVTETTGVSLQLIGTGGQELLDVAEDPANNAIYRNFTIIK